MFKFNEEQERIINNGINHYYDIAGPQVYEYTGGPGTGKSVVLYEIIKQLGLDIRTQVAAMSFTGTASLIMRLKGFPTARTAHSWTYEVKAVPMRDEHGKVVYDPLLNVPIMMQKFVPVHKLPNEIDLIVIDEGYCLPINVGKHIRSFGKKMIVCGDANQLPPVGQAPAFLDHPGIDRLTKTMRQIGKDDITEIANTFGSGCRLSNGFRGNSLVIDRNQLTSDILLWADIIICGSNETKDAINAEIRVLRGYTSKLPQAGEKIVCRSNNWLDGITMSDGSVINVTNGMVCTVLSNPDVYTLREGMVDITLSPDILPSAIFTLKCNYDHLTSSHKVRESIRNNRYAKGTMFEFGYCITTYMSQGGQWHNVVYIEEYLPTMQNRLNLVGASRADNFLVYVKM